MATRFSALLCLIILLAINTSNGQVDSLSLSDWNLEYDAPIHRLSPHPTLISFGDQLLVFNVDWDFAGGHKLAPGIFQDGVLERMPNPIIGRINSHTIWQDKLILAGRFQVDFSGSGSAGNPKLKTTIIQYDGNSWEELIPNFQGRINALADWNGNLVVAGQIPVGHEGKVVSLVQWDGNNWQEFPGQPKGGGEARILCLATNGGELFVGGVFEEIDKVKAWNMAAFDGQNWRPVGSGANGAVQEIGFYNDELFARGQFTCIGGKQCTHLGRWDGHQWHPLLLPGPGGTRYRPFFSSRMLTTPDGVFFETHAESLKNVGEKKDLPEALCRWKNGKWDAGLPSIHGLTKTIVLKKGRKPSRNSGDHDPDKIRPLSEPKTWPEESDREMVVVPLKGEIEDMVWHQDRYVQIISYQTQTDHYRTGRMLQELEGNSWQDLLPSPHVDERWVGSYRDGDLYLAGSIGTGRELLWRQGLDQEIIGLWHQRGGGPGDILVQGDSILVAGRFNLFNDRQFHHVACFDGTTWQTMGQGIPFDFLRRLNWHRTPEGLFLSGTFRNIGCRSISGLLKWDGVAWSLIESEPDRIRQSVYGSNGLNLFRAGFESEPWIELRDKHHDIKRFPATSKPYIQIRKGNDWQTVWHGKTGTVRKFVGDGTNFWAYLTGGVNETILQWSGHAWATIADQPIAPKREFTFMGLLDDLPLIETSGTEKGGCRGRRLAVLKNGKWFFTGPIFPYLQVLPPINGSPTFKGNFLTSSCQKRPGTLCWNGHLNDLSPVPLQDLEKLAQLEAECRASDQRDRIELDLPWPKGVGKSGRDLDTPPHERSGWHLSSWPDSFSIQDIVEQSGKNSLLLKPNTSPGISFIFPWEPDKVGQLEFEFRLSRPEHWYPNLNVPLSAHGRPNLPYLDLHANADHHRVIFWSQDQSWHKVILPFGTGKDRSQSNMISITAGQTATGDGHLEIRNLRFRKKNYLEFREQVEEMVNILEQYPAPLEARERMETFLDRVKSGGGQRYSFLPDIHRTGTYPLYSKGELGKYLLSHQERPTDSSDKNFARDSVVENFGGQEVLAGWLPGGGWYFSLYGLGDMIKTVGYLEDFQEDPLAMSLANGIVLDLRNSYITYPLHSQEGLTSIADNWSFFVDRPTAWMRIQPDSRSTSYKDWILPRWENPWKSLPVVVLVDQDTPGHLVLLLNSIPQITTIGRPSAPISAPTRPHFLLNGKIGYFPSGFVFDNRNRNVSFCRITPDIVIPLNASYDAAIREGMNVLGLKPDPESNFCPQE